jgi:hypothetical protein
MESLDYRGENMLVGANNLNNFVKHYLDSRRFDPVALEEYKLDLEEYIRDIKDYNFAPRTDNLTKEGILIDLNENLKRITEYMEETFGGRRKRKTRRLRRKKNRRTRNKRNLRKIRR